MDDLTRTQHPVRALTVRSPPIAPSTRWRMISSAFGRVKEPAPERGPGRSPGLLLAPEQGRMPYRGRSPTPEDINALSIVKLHHAKKKLERGFFTARPTKSTGTRPTAHHPGGDRGGDPGQARMEEYIIGPVFNLDFFYSPLEEAGRRSSSSGWTGASSARWTAMSGCRPPSSWP